jgi:hypothetical protein
MGANCSSDAQCVTQCKEMGLWLSSNESSTEIGDLALLAMDESFVGQGFMDEDDKDVNNIECALKQGDATVGDHPVPLTDLAAAEDFKKNNLLEKVISECRVLLMDTFDLCEEDIRGVKGLVCAVSQPGKNDCPLIYVSDGFENLTGYPGAFALGRSCRFLQPTAKILNDAINLKDRVVMRDFCVDYEKHQHGSEVVNLLLNERYDGARFWNLLKMVYVEVSGDKYIFAVQTPLASYLPKALKARVDGKEKNKRIVDALPVFAKRLNDLRDGLAERTGESIYELATFASGFLDGFVAKPKSQKGMVKVNAMPAMDRMSKKVGGRKSSNTPSVKPDQLCLRFQSVAGLTVPVPNKNIPIEVGKTVVVNVDSSEYVSMFAVLSMDQYSKVRPIALSFDLIIKSNSAPMVMVTIVSSLANKTGVKIDDEPASTGTCRPVQVGSTIEFADAFVLRVASLKSKLNSGAGLTRVHSK